LRATYDKPLPIETAGERDLVVVDHLSERSQPRDDDRVMAGVDRDERRADAGMSHDYTRFAHQPFDLAEGQVVNTTRAGGRNCRRSALHDDLLARAEIVQLYEQSIKRGAIGTDGDEDHGRSTTCPAYRKPQRGDSSSGHWP